MKKNIYEILEEVELGEDEFETVDIIRRNDNKTWRDYLTAVFNKDITFHDMGLDEIDYKADVDSPPGMGLSNFAVEGRMIYLFIEGHPKAAPGLTDEKRKNILRGVLESLEAKEATAYLNMLRKKPGVKNLTRKNVKLAFPDLAI